MNKNPPLIVATLAALALILSACGGVAATGDTASDGRTASERTDTAPAPEPPAPGPEEGSRENPFPYGFDASIYQGNESNVLWNLRVDAPRVVTSEVLGANQFNAPPQPGHDYVAIPVHVVWNGDEPVTPWLDFNYGLNVAFVTSDGVTMEEEFVVLPDGWLTIMDVGDLYQGGAADFNTIVQVPTGATGTVRVTTGSTFDSFWG